MKLLSLLIPLSSYPKYSQIILFVMILCSPGLSYAGKAPLIQTESIVINESAQNLYAILTDFARYEQWNPWIYKAMGEAVVGAHVWAKLELNDRELESDHIIVELSKANTFCWKDEMWYSFMAGGKRCRYLEAQPDGTTKVWGTFKFNGVFSGLGHLMYADQMHNGMTAELLGLKQWAETKR